MLSISKGYSTDYLTSAIAGGREGYYQAAVDAGGEPPGVWYGSGAGVLGLHGEVDAELMEAIYSNYLDPRDENTHNRATWGEAATLGAPARNYRSADAQLRELLAREPGATPERRAELKRKAEADARGAVRFWDMTFSPGKDVTVLALALERASNLARAAGEDDMAEAWAAMHRSVERAVMMGARASIDVVEDMAGYARVGNHAGRAGRWKDAHNFVVAQFLQHDSREKDPQLHVHQAILNKTLDEDGNWRALDGTALHNVRPAAGAVGERVMEAELTRTLGLRFETRPDGMARQIVGVDQAVMDLFSKRTRAITPKAAEAFREFAEFRGREPNALEQFRIAKEISLSTRRAKSHTAEDPSARAERWEREAQQVLAGGLAAIAHTALHAGGERPREDWSERDVIDRAIDRVAEKKGSWTHSDLLRAVSDVLPANIDLPAEKIPEFLIRLTDKAIAHAERVTAEESVDDLPDELKLANGDSAYARPYAAKYASGKQFAAERKLREAAVERGASAMSEAEAQAFLNRFGANGVELGADQRAAVLGVLTDEARVSVLAAAAGAGKSFTVGAIADAWRTTGRQVYGLAPGQAQADVLTAEGLQSFNITRWLLGGKGVPAPQPGDVVVVDEASMATTQALTDVLDRVREADAKLVLVGDSHQLGAVGPGGGFADIEKRAARYELVEVRRFHDDWEKTASLRLRSADDTVVEEYDKHGRIHAGGTQEQAAADAARAWLADTVSGKDSLLVVGSNEEAYRVSAQLRAELVRLGRVEEHGLILGMDGNTAGVGDLVQGRRNGWGVQGFEDNGDRCPINRQVYRVVGVRDDGGLTVEPAKGGLPMQIPSDYVAEHLTLAYASTTHAAEGRTVDTAHAVVSSATNANALYVQMTRGRDGNSAWVVTRHTNQENPVGEAQDVEIRDALAVIGDVLTRAELEKSVHAEQEESEDEAVSTMTPLERLSAEANQFNSARATQLLDLAAATGEITDEQRQRLAADPAMEGLANVLRQAEVAGHDAVEVLGRALQGRSLDTATSPAAVLHHRIRETTDLAARLQSAHDLVPRGVPERWERRFASLAERVDQRRHELGAQVAVEQPAWAVAALGPVPEDAVERQAWEQRAGWAAASRESMGYTDSVEPLSSAPAAGMPEKSAVWRTAHLELDLPDRSPEEASMSDGALRNRVAAWERERVWAPRYVGDELAATSERLAQVQTNATLWRENAEQRDLPADEREQLLRASEEAGREAEQLAVLKEQLEEADAVRTRWYLHTLETRDRAARSTTELEARGVDVADPGDRVFADEWLAAEAEARVEDDAHREITEHDMSAPVDEDVRADEAMVETALVDIRQSATPTASEFSDEPVARRIPSTEETAADVARARDVLREIEARTAAEAEYERDAAQWTPAPSQARADEAVHVHG